MGRAVATSTRTEENAIVVAARLSPEYAAADEDRLQVQFQGLDDYSVRIDLNDLATLQGLSGTDAVLSATAFEDDYVPRLNDDRTPSVTVYAAMRLGIRRADTMGAVGVSDLTNGIEFSLPLVGFINSSDAQLPLCYYYDEVGHEWSTEGVVTLSIGDGVLRCKTFHCSLFGGVVVRLPEAVPSDCRIGVDPFSQEGLDQLSDYGEWVMRPASLLLLAMSFVVVVLMYDSVFRESNSRKQWAWTDECWRVNPQLDKPKGHPKCWHAFGLGKHFAGRHGLEHDESGFLKILSKVADVHVKQSAGYQFSLSASSVELFTETWRFEDPVELSFQSPRHFLNSEQKIMLTRCVKRQYRSEYHADQKMAFSGCGVLCDAFFNAHSCVQLVQFDICVSASTRALRLLSWVFGSFLLSTMFYFPRARSFLSPSDCDVEDFKIELVYSLIVGTVTYLVAWIPAFMILSPAVRNRFHHEPGDDKAWAHRMNKQRMQDMFAWSMGLVYLFFCIFVCFLFVANVSAHHAKTWFASAATSIVHLLVIAPFVNSVLTTFILRSVACEKLEQMSRRTTGVDRLEECAALRIQAGAFGQLARIRMRRVRRAVSTPSQSPGPKTVPDRIWLTQSLLREERQVVRQLIREIDVAKRRIATLSEPAVKVWMKQFEAQWISAIQVATRAARQEVVPEEEEEEKNAPPLELLTRCKVDLEGMVSHSKNLTEALADLGQILAGRSLPSWGDNGATEAARPLYHYTIGCGVPVVGVAAAGAMTPKRQSATGGTPRTPKTPLTAKSSMTPGTPGGLLKPEYTIEEEEEDEEEFVSVVIPREISRRLNTTKSPQTPTKSAASSVCSPSINVDPETATPRQQEATARLLQQGAAYPVTARLDFQPPELTFVEDEAALPTLPDDEPDPGQKIVNL